ncbi:HET-domain-containing protein [Decorospora gaudefroyi]|uniref:HET-domain-containing protein n=1 Tax=Decorospora gaudefroyi TaxID=184978 RepID=A0A6A5KHD5_9PLEO|nr:HET-domain-containing protein [Decorospora gaudefroyi]
MLSHCWGDASFIKLVTRDLPRFKEGLSLDQLPKSFVDAIAVAMFLNVRYIWIDSLVILQDNTEDWAYEASCMELVYKNSVCNIGATASKDSNGGLFFKRMPETLLPHRWMLEGVKYELNWVNSSSQDWVRSVEEQPLMRRGWVVQERWLCPRMLHFCKEQVYRECRAMNGCEAFPHMDGTVVSLKSGRHNVAYSQWRKLVRFYSSCNLTFQKDKVVAFSGIAKEIQRESNDVYLAGLWKTTSYTIWLGKHWGKILTGFGSAHKSILRRLGPGRRVSVSSLTRPVFLGTTKTERCFPSFRLYPTSI